MANTKATEAQKRYLHDLVLEADGEVDEEWLESLTKARANREIERYGGNQWHWRRNSSSAHSRLQWLEHL